MSSRIDARVREMQVLARLAREAGDGHATSIPDVGSELDRQMMISLVHDGYVNGIDSHPDLHPGVHWQEVLRRFEIIRMNSIGALVSRAPLKVRISHKGRVRLAELEQQLKTSRGRDPTGLCIAKRHLKADLAVAVTHAETTAPLSVISIDMNGLKEINDTHRHGAGDKAIRVYLEAVVATFGEQGESYRGEGGDEAVVLLPGADDEKAGGLLYKFVEKLGKPVIMLGTKKVGLTASCGSASTTDPNEDVDGLLDRSDKVQYRAKKESKNHDPRVSAIAIGGAAVTTYEPTP